MCYRYWRRLQLCIFRKGIWRLDTQRVEFVPLLICINVSICLMFRRSSSLCAGLAQTADLHCHLLGAEGMVIAPMGEALADMRVGEFLDQAAALADGKGCHVVFVVRVLAGHIGIKALEPVGEALLDQLVQGPVDCRRRHGALGPHLVEDLIGRERVLGGAQNPVNPLLGVVQVLKAVVVMRGSHLKSLIPRMSVSPYTS